MAIAHIGAVYLSTSHKTTSYPKLHDEGKTPVLILRGALKGLISARAKGRICC